MIVFPPFQNACSQGSQPRGVFLSGVEKAKSLVGPAVLCSRTPATCCDTARSVRDASTWPATCAVSGSTGGTTTRSTWLTNTALLMS
ncbi:hypothetical protein BaRGS_00027546 [Batillaria attramentaria]|uniref:Uncharacterized protein n=1 Tax=Batillaria attramentaria TaxID=370345 RepID=A0ABD0K2Q3_9CAEN